MKIRGKIYAIIEEIGKYGGTYLSWEPIVSRILAAMPYLTHSGDSLDITAAAANEPHLSKTVNGFIDANVPPLIYSRPRCRSPPKGPLVRFSAESCHQGSFMHSTNRLICFAPGNCIAAYPAPERKTQLITSI